MILNSNKYDLSIARMASGVTVIADGTEFTGNIPSSSPIRIEGYVKGDIYSDSAVTISSNGRMDGIIMAKKLVIDGIFNGFAESVVVEILPKGKVEGELIYHMLAIEAGGRFCGKLSKRAEWSLDIGKSKLRAI